MRQSACPQLAMRGRRWEGARKNFSPTVALSGLGGRMARCQKFPNLVPLCGVLLKRQSIQHGRHFMQRLSILLLIGLVGCGDSVRARVEVATDKAVEKLDSVLGSLDVK